MSVKGAGIRKVMMEFVGVRVHHGQMRQAVLVVEQRGPVKCFLAEFGGKFWAEIGESVDNPDGDVDAGGGGACQKQEEEITEW